VDDARRRGHHEEQEQGLWLVLVFGLLMGLCVRGG
jgi:hypothetical protein